MFQGVVAALQAVAAGFVSMQVILAGVCFAGTLIGVLMHVLSFHHVWIIAGAAVLLFSAANIMAAIPAG